MRKYLSQQKNFILFFLFLLCSFVSYAQTVAKNEALSNRRFQKLMKKENAIVLDVRTAKEFSEGHIPAATNIDFQKDDFAAQIQSLDKTKTYLLYCRSGKRSAKALNIFKENGFANVYHLKAGIIEWNGARE